MSRFISLSSTSRILGMMRKDWSSGVGDGRRGGGGGGGNGRTNQRHEIVTTEAAFVQDAHRARNQVFAHVGGQVHRSDDDDGNFAPHRIFANQLEQLKSV